MKHPLLFIIVFCLSGCVDQYPNNDPIITPGSFCASCSGPNAFNFDWTDQDAHTQTVNGADCLSFNITGNGAIKLSGSTNRLCFDQSGNGAVNAHSLRAKTAYITGAGNGAKDFYVTDSLIVVHNGNGVIHYRGNPVYINIQNNAGGSVEPW